VERLIKCKFQDNLEFLQWIKKYLLVKNRFWDQYYPGGEYNPKKTKSISKENIRSVRSGEVPKRVAAAAGPIGSRDLVDEYQKVANQLTVQVNELKQSVEQVEKEREFYFGKLREIEVYIQNNNNDVYQKVFMDIQGIMYKVFISLLD
jgi:RP/EB family microtubule-associated protein